MSNKKILKHSFAALTASLMLACTANVFPQEILTASADNNKMETADSVDANTVISDSVSKTDIPNWYKFTVTENGVLHMDFDTSNGSTILLVFYNSAEEKIYSNTMHLKSKTENHVSMADLGIEAGEYYVGVGYADILSYAEDVNYDLTINFTADENCETELNNSKDTADVLPLNGYVKGNLYSSSDADWYKFTVDGNGCIKFDFDADFTDESAEWGLEIYNSESTSYMYSFKFGGKNKVTSSSNLGLEKGEYYAKVKYSTYSTGNYKLSLSSEPDSHWESEPNNKIENADSTELNSYVSGNLYSSSDVDFYKFTVDENGCLNFDFDADFTDESAEWGLEIYNSESTSSMYSFKFGGKNKVTSSANFGLEKGEYYAKVKYSTASAGDYKLSLNFEPDSHWESESNDKIENADNAELNSYVSGNLYSSSDVDFYKFTVDESGYVNFDFETSAESGEWKLELFENADSKFSFYEKTFKAGEETNITDDIGLDKGEYYIKIRNSVWRGNDYKLNLNFVKNDKWESEFNNDFDTADEILPNTTTSGCLMASNDKDYYKFTLENDGYINLDFISKAVGNAVAYYTMELMDSTEKHTVIYTVQIWGDSELVESGNIGLAKGTYFVRVKPNSTFKENYSVKLSYEESQNWEQEYNNTKDTANFFAMNSTKKGNLKKSPDTDYYKFEMTEDGTIFIDFERPMDGTTTTYWVVGIIDEKGTYVQRYYMKGNESLTSTEGLALAKGNYYMHIQASSFNSSDYKITLRDSDYKEPDQTEILYGDANLDGKVSISDAVAILQYLANSSKYPLEENAKINADVDGADGVTGRDAAEIQKYDAKVIDSFVVEEK